MLPELSFLALKGACLLYVSCCSEFDGFDLIALIRSAMNARRPADFTSSVYCFRRCH